MHTLSTDHRVLQVYLPWLAALLAGALEWEGVHRLRRAMWGVHPIPPGVGWLVLCGLGMAGAIALSYALIYICHALHSAAPGYWLPWSVYLGYMTVIVELERRGQRGAALSVSDSDSEV